MSSTSRASGAFIYSPVRLVFVGLIVVIASLSRPPVASVVFSGVRRETPVEVPLRVAFGKLPLAFEVNAGQTAPEVRFLARGYGYGVFLTATEAVIAISGPRGHGAVRDKVGHVTEVSSRETSPPRAMRMKLVDGRAPREIRGLQPLREKTSHLKGSDRRHWQTNVATFAMVEYVEVYPGIDLRYHGNQQELEYDFIVHPGADPEAIRIDVEGIDDMQLDANGDLVTRLGDYEIHHRKPVVYQEVDGRRQEIAGDYIQRGNQIQFALGPHDASRPLVLDPVLRYSTHFGGGNQDQGIGLAIDDLGSVYVTGETLSSDFPGVGFPNPTICGFADGFIVKLDPSGSSVVFSTFFGGCDREWPTNVAVDQAHNVYIVGMATSRDFPTLAAVQPLFGGGLADVFVLKLDPDGSPVYSTYLGGTGSEYGNVGLAIDEDGEVFVCGITDSRDFPRVNALQPSLAGLSDGFVTKLSAAGSALVYSTYLGGSGRDSAESIAVGASGAAYVTGSTHSTDFPTISAFQPNFAGGDSDAFVAAINTAGSALLFSTYLGGTGSPTDGEVGLAIKVDGPGDVYVAGLTPSRDFPVMRALQPTFGGGTTDGFVAKLRPDGALVMATYLGGSGSDMAQGIAVDQNGNVYVCGGTNSPDFPTVRPLQPTLLGLEAGYVAKIDASGTRLLYSTYLGGTELTSDVIRVAVDADGNAYITGHTWSADFPTVSPVQLPAGGIDAFISKIADPPCADNVTASLDVFRFSFQPIPFTPVRFQWVVFRNRSSVPFTGPLAFVMDDLQNAVFIGGRLVTRCMSAGGDPFIVVGTGNDHILNPNEFTLTGLWFYKTSVGEITYTPHLLSGIPAH